MSKIIDSRIPLVYEHVSEFLSREPKTNMKVCKCCNYCENIFSFITGCEFNYNLCHHHRNKKYIKFNTKFCDFFKKFYLRRILKKVSETFLLGICLLLVINFPATMSAPVPTNQEESPEWFYNGTCNTSQVGQVKTDAEFAYGIRLQCQIARKTAIMLQDHYIQTIFKKNPGQHHVDHQSKHLPWVPTADQVRNETANLTASPIGFEDTLIRCFNYLQKAAVGMEQAVWDLSQGDEFLNQTQAAEMEVKFNNTYSKFTTLIQTIKIVLSSKGICQVENFGRNIMPETFKIVKGVPVSGRHMRDYLILRESIRAMTYTLDVLKTPPS